MRPPLPVRPSAPVEVEQMARARADARARRDWAVADALRAEIDASGWRVIDSGTGYTLEPAAAADVVEDERIRYGSSTSVPSRMGEPPVGPATVVMIATDRPADVARATAGLRAHAPSGTTVVVVANDPSDEQVAMLDHSAAAIASVGGSAPEVLWTSVRLGHAAALNAGLRRVTGPVAVLLDTSVEPLGDVVTPLVAALRDPAVAVVGSHGVTTTDLRRFEAAPAGDVDAVLGYCVAFRRSDAVARGPLDEHFRFYRNLDLWWSLVLRDEGEGRPPRRAVALDLPLAQHEHRDWVEMGDAERQRLSKRNFYRLLDRFGRRSDLLTDRTAPPPR